MYLRKGCRRDPSVTPTTERNFAVIDVSGRPFRAALAAGLLWSIGACAGAPEPLQVPPPPTVPARDTHETLNSVLWVETAAEYQMTTVEIYKLARDRLDAALRDPGWTAATEQIGGDFADLPPAIILDVDETVLDNSRYQAELLLRRESFTPASWIEWMNKSASQLVPGAKEFLDYAKSRGVAIYYVTNRDAIGQVGTARNLRAVGLDVDDAMSNLMMRGETDEWGSNKSSRRAEVAKTHRILLLLGDDLNDFIAGVRDVGPDERIRVAASHRDFWGERWIMLPNPIYGSWESALNGNAGDDAGRLAAKRGHLRGHE